MHSITALLCALSGLTQASTFDYSDEYTDTPPRSDIIPRVTNLEADAERAAGEGIPLLIEFSTAWCEYCRALEQQVLEPMIRSGDYDDRVILRKLMVDDHNTVRDFDGSPISASAISLRAGVELYPTILFFGADGREVAKRIVGITVLDFIPLQIDKAVERARRSMSAAPPR